MHSKLFTKAELASLNKRLAGNRADPTGIYCERVKPKVKELVYIWLAARKDLRKLVEK